MKMNKEEKCPKCESINIISHTDKKLRKEKKLVYQCFDCNHFWKTDW